jgi:UDP-2,4-diacetamido-2,4,6-trideoxy-beta-L-altropyranose hydrolase
MMIVFRVDASIKIGTGHVIRDLTLAEKLSKRGAKCNFISRAHPGHLIDLIRARGFQVHELPQADSKVTIDLEPKAGDQTCDDQNTDWLGTTQAEDSVQCSHILSTLQPDWLVVDHYSIGVEWEARLRSLCNHIMVIDDLANRRHACDLLIDQTFGRSIADYLKHVDIKCRLLCGSGFALIRDDFIRLRPYSLSRRKVPKLKRILISMGGVDQNNATGTVLNRLGSICKNVDVEFVVVMGSTAPWIGEVREQASRLRNKTTVLAGVENMAELMAEADLAVGAAGTTAWERCCLGLPSIIVTLASNQKTVAKSLHEAGAAKLVSLGEDLHFGLSQMIEQFLINPAILNNISKSAARIVDGTGGIAVVKAMEELGATKYC